MSPLDGTRRAFPPLSFVERAGRVNSTNSARSRLLGAGRRVERQKEVIEGQSRLRLPVHIR
ncbi:hypothetical protein Z948_495 [Sulfitobacter donghicola DSW-25 = KCTC 12864 = JCM 14565]|nr:hypothetical protein Z948_495 [Sulfitobacter donghicola DSW-25 = KCTC 12864 = JCM 14565]